MRADELFCALKYSSRCDVCKRVAELLLLPASCFGRARVLGDPQVTLHGPDSISVIISAYERCVTGSVNAGGAPHPGKGMPRAWSSFTSCTRHFFFLGEK